MEITKREVPPTHKEREMVKPAKVKVINVGSKFHKIHCSFSLKFCFLSKQSA